MKKVYDLLKKYYIFSLVILMMGNAADVFAQPAADAGSDATICENQTHELSDATASGYDALLWGTSGNGTFSENDVLNPVYYPGDADGNSVVLTLTASMAGEQDAVDNMNLTIAQLPEPYAGPDATICGGNNFDIVDAEIIGGSYNFFSWNGGFDGVFQPSSTAINPTYVPGGFDLDNGEVTINLVVQPTSPCVAIQSDSFILTFSDEINADAGSDAEICEGDTYQLDGSTTNATSSTWTTDGDGGFDDALALDAIYTPGSNDILNGSVTLTLTAENQYCDPDADDMILTINPLPAVTCPSDFTVCIDDAAVLLTGATPAGGTYIGDGVAAGEFDPAVAGTGPHTITYAYVDPVTGCNGNCIFTIVVNDLPTVTCPTPFSVCEDDDPVTLTGGTPAGGIYSGTGVSGGSFDPAVGVGTYPITYTYTDQVTGCTNSCDFDIEVAPLPLVNAGDDETVCEDETVSLDADVEYGCATTWTTLGDGQFDDNNIEDPTYSLGFTDIQNGSVTLKIFVEACSPCSVGQADELTITIQRAPVADAGTEVTICEDETYTLDQSSATDACGYLWSSLYGGTFDDNTILNAEYTPSATDIANGYASLTLTAKACNPCDIADTDDLTITIQKNPSVDILFDDTLVCEQTVFDFANLVDYQNHDAVIWVSVNGDAGWNNNNLEYPTYTLTQVDAIQGTVNITVQATAKDPCFAYDDDQCTLTVQPLPFINAGTDQTICEDATATLGDATALDAGSLLWTDIVALDGTFDDATALNPVFTPGQNAIDLGYTTLKLTAQPVEPCTIVSEDDVTITIQHLPLVDAGVDMTICEGQNLILNGTVDNTCGQNYEWTTSGDGTFDNTIYYPGQNDINDGSVTLTLTGFPCLPCSQSQSDDLVLTFSPNPTVDLGDDINSCEGDVVQLNAIIENGCAIQWNGGAGTFSEEDIANPTYTPGFTDYIAGSVTLNIDVAPCSPCTTSANDMVIINFQKPPTAEAGNPQTVCEDQTVQLDGSITNACGSLWSSASGGTFDDASKPDAIYTPSQADIDAESVTLTLTAVACEPCSGDDTDDVTISIQHLASATFSFVDTLICEGTDFVFTPDLVEYNNNGSVIWGAINGSGAFDDETLLYPTYSSTFDDALQGSVTLVVNIAPLNPCTNSTEEFCTLIFQRLPMVEAGADKTVCENGEVDLDDATASEYESLLWTGTYPDDSFSDATALNPTYSPGANAIAAGETFLTLTAQSLDPCTATIDDFLKVTIQHLPLVDAGSDETICEDSNYQLSGSIEIACGTPSFGWTTDGTGSFDDANSLTAVYTPSAGDIANGSVTLTLTGYPCSPCVDSFEDSMVLTIQQLPEVDAGADANVCESGFFLLEAEAYNYSGVSWSTDGDGTFDSETALNPTYYPGSIDASTGTVTLKVVAYADLPCTQSDEDEITLNVQPLPVADAGADDTACETGYTFQSGAVAVYNNSNLEWTSNGDGEFDDATQLLSTYTPGDIDVASGIVTLTLVANPIHPCVVSDQDDMNLVIFEAADVDAGPDATICDTDSYLFEDATAENYETITWTTTGDGSFDDVNALNPTYYPGTGDIALGTVELCLGATSTLPCTETPDDCMILTIQGSPTADAGTDGSMCETGGEISGTATNYSAFEWATDGDGAFDDFEALVTNYTPGSGDILNGSFTLTLTVDPKDPCTLPASDDVTYFITLLPVADAGADVTICETGIYEMVGSADNYCGTLWETAGDGTFDVATSLTAEYTPGAADLAAGSVTLTLTAKACSPCDQDDTDEMMINFQVAPESYAGEDATLCEDAIFLNDATVANNASILWTTSGDGTWSDASALTPQYFPGANDKIHGEVTLTITATPNFPCDVAAKDDIVIHIILNPVVVDLDDAEICEGDTYTIPAAPVPNVENYSSLLWSTTGTGTFDDDTSENPTYTPSADDIEAGSVELCVEVMPNNPCVLELEECMILTIQKLPAVFAGDDDTSCGIDPYPLDDATAENYLPGSVLWTTSGDGTFDSKTDLNPTYYPGMLDESNMSVTLQVQVSPVSPCAVAPVTDQMVIYIQLEPTIDAGADDSACQNGSVQLDATAANTSALLWTTTGDGTFSDPTIEDPIYYPGETLDPFYGSATLTLHGDATLPCIEGTSDMVKITIQLLPTVNAGSDATICENGSYTFADASAMDTSSLAWSGGTGSFDNGDQLDATYNAGVGETGDVELTLTAQPVNPCTTAVDDFMTLTINPLPELTDLTLQGALAELPPLFSPLSGDLINGFGMCLDGMEGSHYWLDVDALVATQTLETGFFNEFYHTATVPVDFFSYWADRGVVSGASGWQGIMWEIINGNQPIFYLVYDGADYVLIDGLQYLNVPSEELPLTIPGNYPQGLYNFTGTIKDVNGCLSEDITVAITFGHAPVANAGDDAEICEDGSYVLSTASVDNASGQMWTTGGDGSFVDATLVNAKYMPGTQDAANGSVELCLVAEPIEPCFVNSEADCMTLTIQRQPTVFAGDDDTSCGLEPFMLSDATADDYQAILWTTSGDGTFDDNTLVTPTYYPGTVDQDNLSVTLTISASPIAPCSGQSIEDEIVIFIQLSPVADAGEDAEICEDDSYTLINASAENNDGQSWTTAGDGTFSDVNELNPTYYPGTEDITNGSVELCLVALAKAPCIVNSNPDCMILTFAPLPTADAGDDGVVCEDGSYQIAGATVANADGQLWSTDGDGSFSDVNALNPIYYPGTGDIADGSIELCLVALPQNPCVTSSDPDCMTLDIQYLPVAHAGDDATTCANELYQLSGSVDFSTSYIWSTSGDGTFDNENSLTATYTPSDDDLADGNVTLTLTAFAETPCTGQDVDDMVLIFNEEPAVIFANEDGQFYQDATLTYCFDETVTVTLDEILSGTAPFDFEWDVYEGGNFVESGNAYGVELDGELFSNTYPAGEYTISLTLLEDANDCSPTDISVYTVNVVVNPQPNPFFTIDDDPLLPGGEYDYCYDVTEAMLALVEEQGGQTSVGTPPFDIAISINGGLEIPFTDVNFGDEINLLDYTTTTPDEYNIQVTSVVDDNGCAIPEQVLLNYYYFTVNIHEEPAVIFAANGNQFYEGAELEYCEGETVIITLDEVLSGTGPFDIEYTVDGDVEIAEGVIVGAELFNGPLAAGTYPIQITSIVDANGCEPADYTPYNATVVVAPPPAVIFAANGTPFYEGETLEFCFDENVEVTLNEILLGTAPFTFEWEVNGDPGFASGIELNDPLFSALLGAGTYNVQITSITDANGCSPLDVSMYNVTFVVHPQPNPFFTIDDDPLLPGGEFEYCYDVSDIMLALVEEQGGQTSVGTPPFDISISINNGPSIDFDDAVFGDEFNMADYTSGPGTYNVQVISVEDANGCAIPETVLNNYYYFTVTINPEPTLAITLDGSAPQAVNEYCWNDDFEICLEGVDGTPEWTVQWAVTGPGGTLGDVMTGVSECFPFNAADFLPGTYDLTIVSLTDADGCATSQTTLDTYAFQIEVLPEPTLAITLDGDTPEALNLYCDTESFEICIEGVDGTPDWTVEWAVTGPGGPFGDVMTGISECFPFNAADFLPGTYDLTIVSLTDAKECVASQETLDSYAFQIEIVASPSAYAGEDATICEGEDFLLGDATAENYSALFWSSNGQGDFDNPSAVNPTYQVDPADVGNTVIIFLVAQPNSPCLAIANDNLSLFIQPAPVADAGADASVCEGEVYPLDDATAEYTTSTLWETADGLGVFADETAVNTSYLPAAGDVGNTVTLCLTAEPEDPCTTADEDCMSLVVLPLATAFAGNDATIQSDETYTLSEATADNYSGLLWETSGDGGFDNANALNPIYTPGMQDIIDGEVLLTLNAIGVEPCGNDVHNMLLTIEGIPPVVEITSPVDGTFFNYSPILVEGTASDFDGFVSFVEVRVNGGAWQMATGTDNWSIEVQLDPCLNTIEARATDTQFLVSEIDAVTDIKLNGQLIEMTQGWSYISSYIEATDPDLFVLDDYIVPANNLVIMLNDEGLIHWPSEEVNTLGNWNTQYGYKIKSDAEGTWLLAGENTANQTITLDVGPNIFPVLTNVDYPLPGDFNDEDILIIFELQTARIYWPDGGLNTLTELKPGFGYLGNFYNSFDITYPDYVDCELKSGSNDVEYVTNVSPWELERTASVHFISITNDAVEGLDNAEFIGAFDANGMCIGYADVREKADNYLLAIYGDESATGWKDGAAVGEAINLVAYNGVEEDIVANYDMSMPNFDGRYANNGLSKITSFKGSSTGIGGVATSDMIKIYPNPATDVVSIYYPVDTQVEVTLTNASGSVVMTQVMSEQESQIDVSNLQPGVYFVKFESKGSTAVKRLVIK